MDLIESDLQFTFNEEWRVMAYDKHRYYRAISGAGMRGVDFIGIYRNEQVVLIEVKHFRNPNGKISTDQLRLLEAPNDFVERLNDKGADTLKAIRAIFAYLKRKWWFRRFLPRFQKNPVEEGRWRDWHFWAKVHQLIFEEGRLCYLLWLEVDPAVEAHLGVPVETLIDTLWMGVRLKEFKTLDFQIASTHDNHFEPSLRVKPLR